MKVLAPAPSFELRRWVFFGAWGAVLAVSSKVVYDLEHDAGRHGPVIAHLADHRGEVMTRGSDVAVWTSVSPKQEFGDGDVIATGEDAGAVITFRNGPSVAVDARTQFVVSLGKQADKADFVVAVVKGRLRVAQSVASSQSSGRATVVGVRAGDLVALSRTKADLDVRLPLGGKAEIAELMPPRVASLSLIKPVAVAPAPASAPEPAPAPASAPELVPAPVSPPASARSAITAVPVSWALGSASAALAPDSVLWLTTPMGAGASLAIRPVVAGKAPAKLKVIARAPGGRPVFLAESGGGTFQIPGALLQKGARGKSFTLDVAAVSGGHDDAGAYAGSYGKITLRSMADLPPGPVTLTLAGSTLTTSGGPVLQRSEVTGGASWQITLRSSSLMRDMAPALAGAGRFSVKPSAAPSGAGVFVVKQGTIVAKVTASSFSGSSHAALLARLGADLVFEGASTAWLGNSIEKLPKLASGSVYVLSGNAVTPVNLDVLKMHRGSAKLLSRSSDAFFSQPVSILATR